MSKLTFKNFNGHLAYFSHYMKYIGY